MTERLILPGDCVPFDRLGIVLCEELVMPAIAAGGWWRRS
jgi:hypothetical protein